MSISKADVGVARGGLLTLARRSNSARGMESDASEDENVGRVVMRARIPCQWGMGCGGVTIGGAGFGSRSTGIAISETNAIARQSSAYACISASRMRISVASSIDTQ